MQDIQYPYQEIFLAPHTELSDCPHLAGRQVNQLKLTVPLERGIHRKSMFIPGTQSMEQTGISVTVKFGWRPVRDLIGFRRLQSQLRRFRIGFLGRSYPRINAAANLEISQTRWFILGTDMEVVCTHVEYLPTASLCRVG